MKFVANPDLDQPSYFRVPCRHRLFCSSCDRTEQLGAGRRFPAKLEIYLVQGDNRISGAAPKPLVQHRMRPLVAVHENDSIEKVEANRFQPRDSMLCGRGRSSVDR